MLVQALVFVAAGMAESILEVYAISECVYRGCTSHHCGEWQLQQSLVGRGRGPARHG